MMFTLRTREGQLNVIIKQSRTQEGLGRGDRCVRNANPELMASYSNMGEPSSAHRAQNVSKYHFAFSCQA